MRIFTILVAALLFLNACRFGRKTIKGNGNITTTQRSERNFSKIHQSGPYDVYVSNGDFNITVEAEENLQRYIITEVKGGRLAIHTKNDVRISSTRQVKIFVTAPDIEKISSSGSGNLYSESVLSSNNKIEFETTGSADIDVNVDAPEIEAGVTGSGNIKIKGKTRKLEAVIRGSGDIKALDLKSEETKINIAGSGNAEVFASIKLDIDVAGSGDVKYKGNAPQINSNMHGSGSLKKID